MKEINTEIGISSTPEKVWETLMDLPNWSNWNPIVNKIEGNLKIGQELYITMSSSNGNDGKKYKSIIGELDENKRFTFVAIIMTKLMFSSERIIELRERDSGTILTQREIYTGLMVSLFWNKLSSDAYKMLNSMNKALKKEIEK